MNDDELKRLWQQQPLRDPAISAAQVMSAMRTKTTLLRRALLRRDVIELGACVLVIGIFGFYFFANRAPAARAGALITVAGALCIACRILYARRTTPAAPPDATLVGSLRAELHSVRTQARLLRTVLWWYLLPLTAGELIFIWGLEGGLYAAIIPVTVVIVGVNVLLYWLNQRAVAIRFVPLEIQLESLIRSAETGDPLDEAQFANLRPIALSAATAGQVKPAEFKVAFWQIALYGEIAFVGIWFFLLVALTVGNQGGNTGAPTPEIVAQPIRADEANRYSAAARKVVDLFNAGDYAAVQKLYDPDMAAAFPPKESTAFYTGIADRYGRIETFDGPTGGGYQGWIAFRLHCQHGELTMSLALDDNGQIAGIYFQRPAGPPLKFGTFVARLFSRQHLLWIVPFFIAGLLFSRMLQKSTARAVGISALGVHLHKGRDLVLWDEIKEIRPCTILNIRSLWLVANTGEKTIMPWTSLERHSDLKAAIESFAPSNHPIREYIHLL